MTIRDRFQGESFTYADLVAVGEELEIALEEATAGWFNGIKPAGFRTSKAETVRLPDASDGTPVYESYLFIKNAGSNLGFFSLEYATEEQRTTDGYEFVSTEPVKLAGASSIEVAIQSSLPIKVKQLKPYLSLNREAFQVPMERHQQPREVARSPKPFIAAATWSVDEGNSIVIDDLDPGFSVNVPSEDAPFLKFGVGSITPNRFSSHGMDAGLK